MERRYLRPDRLRDAELRELLEPLELSFDPESFPALLSDDLDPEDPRELTVPDRPDDGRS